MYYIEVKRKDIEKLFKKFGWEFLRHGANHDVWTNGERVVTIPRHKEINELTAKGIIKMIKINKIERS